MAEDLDVTLCCPARVFFTTHLGAFYEDDVLPVFVQCCTEKLI
jgi:hypothetical protein